MLPTKDVNDCVVCGFVVIPEELRKLWGIHVNDFGREVPVFSLNRQSPLCMVCGQTLDHILQSAVNEMWGLGEAPDGIGKMISIPHTDLEDD